MRILVTGGRSWLDCARVFRTLDEIKPTYVIHGGAIGVDDCAHRWALSRAIPVKPYRPMYMKYGARAAPKVRNQQMLDEGKPDLVVAFPGGSGTADMIGRAQRARIRVVRG